MAVGSFLEVRERDGTPEMVAQMEHTWQSLSERLVGTLCPNAMHMLTVHSFPLH